MKLSSDARALAAALVVDVLVVFLLTPLGFENRPQTALRPGGYLAIATIFVGLGLFLTSLALLSRRARVAARLAALGSILFFFPVVGDQFGAFFSAPIPPVINALEYVLVIVLLVTLFLARNTYSWGDPR